MKPLAYILMPMVVAAAGCMTNQPLLSSGDPSPLPLYSGGEGQGEGEGVRHASRPLDPLSKVKGSRGTPSPLTPTLSLRSTGGRGESNAAALLSAGEGGKGRPTLKLAEATHDSANPSQESRLTLAKCLDLAFQHPDLAVARARAEAARGRLVQAGLYPNPTFTWEGDNMGFRGAEGGNQGPILTQQIVTADKLRLAQNAAAQGVVASEWQATTRWFDLVTRVRLVFFDALTAQEEVKVNEAIVRIAQEGLDAVKNLQKAGVGTQPDVLQAQVELEQSKLRLSVAKQRRAAAEKLLAAAVGSPALDTQALAGSLETPAPVYPYDETLAAVLNQSSEVQESLALILQAEQLLQRSQAERIPNLHVMVKPFYSFIEPGALVKVQIGAPLPLFDRNEGNIRSAQADLIRSHHELRQTELRLTERLAAAFERYRSAQEQKEAFEKRILPQAKESLRLVRLGYERGDPKYDYATVLQAQRTLVQAQLSGVQALGQLWKASSEIAGLLQADVPRAP